VHVVVVWSDILANKFYFIVCLAATERYAHVLQKVGTHSGDAHVPENGIHVRCSPGVSADAINNSVDIQYFAPSSRCANAW
jgi:hypothetical protein